MSARRRFMGRRHWRIYRSQIAIHDERGQVIEHRYGRLWFALCPETGITDAFDTWTDALAYVDSQVYADEFLFNLGIRQLTEGRP